ncbi:Cytosol aminopeptidase [Gryllus bimaculatus]|nr:Cytosol aminopeptidase [Gryllus bimaculatus]
MLSLVAAEGMVAAVGSAATGVYTSSNEMWKEISKAGAITGDRVWRFPLWKYFTKKVVGIRNADVSNRGFGPGGGPCRAAAFLREFVDCAEWVHLDIAGSGMLMETEDVPYMPIHRMSGRPVRMLLQFMYQLACPSKPEVD